MSLRKEDQSFFDMFRDIRERLKKLESSQNNSVKRNDIRLSDVVVTADDLNMRLCLENLNTRQSVCLSEQIVGDPTQAMWSFSGALTVGDVGTFSPPYFAERDCTARQILVGRGYTDAFTGTVSVCVHFNNDSVIIVCDLDNPDEFVTKEINVSLVENDDIRVELTDAGTNAENISVFVRFGTPTLANESVTDCVI